MQLINEIEIAYFRSFYKFKLRSMSDLNIIFGKNDSGKSNVVRALSLFFSGSTGHSEDYDFITDFCDQRLRESDDSDSIRKFLYVKITFNTPKSFQPSLGKNFYVKRQWTVSRGAEYLEEVSSTIPSSKRHILTRLLNKIRFIYIPAIKDLSIFEMLLTDVYDTLAGASDFETAVGNFSREVQDLTKTMFSTLPSEVSGKTKIGIPTQMAYLFETLDFETIAPGDDKPKSLTRQRGDGIKARHIPELLNYISANDEYDFHIWGFEEPENSLDFGAAQAEAKRFLALAKENNVQVFMTTHSPSFYSLEDKCVSKFYVDKDVSGLSLVKQGRELEKFDAQTALKEGFYLPTIASALQNVASVEKRAIIAEKNADALQQELRQMTLPVILTEGRTDAKILKTAWEKLERGPLQFRIRSCETAVGQNGSGNGGAASLGISLKAVASDNPHPVIGIFDLDKAGQDAFKLDKNFDTVQISNNDVKYGADKKSFAFLLPVPEFRTDCKEHDNLPIEFLFEDEYIETILDGRKLELLRKSAYKRVGKRDYKFDLEDVTHLKDVGEGKNFFASEIVPTFPVEAFGSFEPIFDLIEEIIVYGNQ